MLKKFFCSLILLPLIAFAEYNGDHIEFTIELKDGNSIHAYNYLSRIYPNDKTVSYQAYLEQHFDILLQNQFTDGIGDYTYHQHRIDYSFTNNNGYNGHIFTLVDKTYIDINQVKSVTILKMDSFTYATAVSSSHQWNDRKWMQKKALKMFSYGGEFCSHNIYLHENNKQIEAILKRLKQISTDYTNKVKALEEEMKYSDGKDYYNAKKALEELNKNSDTLIDEEVFKLNQFKTVIITNCTC